MRYTTAWGLNCITIRKGDGISGTNKKKGEDMHKMYLHCTVVYYKLYCTFVELLLVLFCNELFL